MAAPTSSSTTVPHTANRRPEQRERSGGGLTFSQEGVACSLMGGGAAGPPYVGPARYFCASSCSEAEEAGRGSSCWAGGAVDTGRRRAEPGGLIVARRLPGSGCGVGGMLRSAGALEAALGGAGRGIGSWRRRVSTHNRGARPARSFESFITGVQAPIGGSKLGRRARHVRPKAAGRSNCHILTSARLAHPSTGLIRRLSTARCRFAMARWATGAGVIAVLRLSAPRLS